MVDVGKERKKERSEKKKVGSGSVAGKKRRSEKKKGVAESWQSRNGLVFDGGHGFVCVRCYSSD